MSLKRVSVLNSCSPSSYHSFSPCIVDLEVSTEKWRQAGGRTVAPREPPTCSPPDGFLGRAEYRVSTPASSVSGRLLPFRRTTSLVRRQVWGPTSSQVPCVPPGLPASWVETHVYHYSDRSHSDPTSEVRRESDQHTSVVSVWGVSVTGDVPDGESKTGYQEARPAEAGVRWGRRLWWTGGGSTTSITSYFRLLGQRKDVDYRSGVERTRTTETRPSDGVGLEQDPWGLGTSELGKGSAPVPTS